MEIKGLERYIDLKNWKTIRIKPWSLALMPKWIRQSSIFIIIFKINWSKLEGFVADSSSDFIVIRENMRDGAGRWR